MIGLTLAIAPQVARVPHTFHFVSAKPLPSVHLAGVFNDWSRTADAMVSQDGGLTWTKTLSLKPGVYVYKLVIDDNMWITDPTATQVDDGNGNTNSQIIISPVGYEIPAALGDGRITASGLSHLDRLPDVNYDRGRLMISMTARPGDIAHLDVMQGGRAFPMRLVGGDSVYARYQAAIPWDRRRDFDYSLRLTDGPLTRTYGPRGLSALAKGNGYEIRARDFHPFVVPGWVEKSVFYQIFPDRFANGDSKNDPADVASWDTRPTHDNRYGGDVEGIEKHLPYLRDLGISAIYFNPIFKAGSNHRYDTIDYLQVDPEFGTNDQFANLTKDLKKLGIRTVLDGVFNHTSTHFFAFSDVEKRGQASPYTHWYTFYGFPVTERPKPNYLCWFGVASLPKVHLLNPATRSYFLKIPTTWMDRAEIAGWRLDAANEVSMDYWRAFRQTVKAKDPNAWILGEKWGDASPWLQGDQWDATMNYRFRDAVLQLVGRGGSGKPSEFMKRLMSAYADYAPQVSRNLLNLIGSHDTTRILTECGGDPNLARLAAVAEFTWVGAPCVYYGDELGMKGGSDPDDRRAMTWSTATKDNPFLGFYRKLIALRKASPVLQSGDPVPILADDAHQVAIYGRRLNNQTALVAINRSAAPQSVLVPASGSRRAVDALSGRSYQEQQGFYHLSLQSERAAILMPVSGSLPHSRLGMRRSTPSRPRLTPLNVHRSTF